jgi:acyl carrier protein
MNENVQRLREWILAHGKLNGSELTDETQLLEERVLSSLQIMDLILFLEQLRGAPVDVEQLRGESFRDLRSLRASFLEAA